jgi:predicted transcriptional regulator of viral defense system
MKALDWHRYLEEQNRLHRKRVFTVTELANVAGTSPGAVNVEVARLRSRGVILRYGRGRYGLPGVVTAEDLVRALDWYAYITGFAALHRHGLVTQVPTRFTCFTRRRHDRARERITPVGRFVFVCVKTPVYAHPEGSCVAPAEQALFDFVYICRRRKVIPEALVTLRNLERLDDSEVDRLAERYPKTVQGHVRRILSSA